MRIQIEQIAADGGAAQVAAAYYDYETETTWSYHGGRWFHAASTIKVAILAALLDAVDQGRFRLGDRLHVRNRFLSAVDAEPFRVATDRDANSEVHEAIGKLMRLERLALHMIATSSNLATNLLLDLVGVEAARGTLERLDVRGIDLRRGVEDDRAFDAGVNNRVTADGLLGLFRAIHEEEAFTPEATRTMRDMLLEQAFKSGIPAGLPDEAQVAHKTGEISTVAHDAGLVFLPDRQPYVVVILTEWASGTSPRKEVVARISQTVYEHLTAPEAPGEE